MRRVENPAYLPEAQLVDVPRRLIRLRFLQQPERLRQETRARVQARINEELNGKRPHPSPLAIAFAAGMYDDPIPGEIDALEAWARRASVYSG